MITASKIIRSFGEPQVPGLPQPPGVMTVAQYNDKRGFGLKAPPKISVLSSVFRDTPAPWIALDGVCIEVPPAHHYEQAAGKAAGWSGFRAIVFGPDWRIVSDTCYSCYYPPNEMQQMRMDFGDVPLGSYVLVATGDATCNSDGSDVENTTAAMQYLGAEAFLREHKQSKMRCSYIGLLHKSKAPVYEDALGKMSSSLCAVIVPPHAPPPPSTSGHGEPQVPGLPQPPGVMTVAQYNDKRGFGLKAPPKISVLSSVFRDTPAPWIALDGVCIEVPPAHHYEQAAGKAAGWSGFRAIVFGPDWRIVSDTCYSCYYPPNDTQQMKEDFCYTPLGSYVLVATGDATCNSDGSDVENITIAMGHLHAPKFLKEHQQNRMRCSYIALLHKGLAPVYEDALAKMSSSLCAVITAPFVPVTTTSSGQVFSGGAKGFMWPLSDALIQRASVSDIIGILDSHPNCIYESDAPDGHGVSAFDLALFHRAHEDVLTQIVRRNPALLAVQQGQGHGGLWPIHRIVINTAPRGALSLAFLKECISLNPRCSTYRSADGVTALFKAMRLKPPTHEVILALLMADLPVLTSGSPNAHYAGALHEVLDANSSLDSQFVCKLVHAVFSAHSHIANALANAVDAAGRRAMNIAHKDVRLLIQSFIFFCGRYEIAKGAPLHRSGTSVVVLASDHGQTADATAAAAPLQVAMKFMMNFEQYDREINMRTRYGISSTHVLTILDSFDAETDPVFSQSLQRIGMERYRFCVTMPAADRSLKSIIDSEHICGRDWDTIKSICSHLCKSLEHMHACGVVHGDMKPLNVVRVNGRMLVIDLDASSPCSNALGYKSSTAYIPPEMLKSSDSRRQIPRPRRPSDENALLASPSFDIWSLGVIFFQLFCGETLFQANDEDNLDADGLLLLQNWGSDPSFRLKKLSKISHPMARHLVSQMLVDQPQHRLLTIAHVLSHSFFTGQPQRRHPDQRPDWDVFISYRVDADAAVAAKLYAALTACGLRVFLDSKCLKDGVPWESGFVDALCKSHCFVPILSRAALKVRFEGLSDSSPCDNVLLEYRLAIELAQRNLIARIFPLFLGDSVIGAFPQRSHYFSSGCQPNAPNSVVSAVEAKATKHLESLGLGLPFLLNMSVKDIFSGITSYQGGFVCGAGDDDQLLCSHVTAIHKMNDQV
jgi:serine/threonine protein kinase